jgi:hypothetical protein
MSHLYSRHLQFLLPLSFASALILSACNDSGSAGPTPPSPNAGKLQFGATSFQANEGTVAVIIVTRSGGNTGNASVTCATDSGGTATAGSDFTSINTSLSWADGESGDKTCHVTLNTDGIVDPAETVNLALNGTSGATLGAVSTAVLTISDNDSPGALQFASATYTVNEAKETVAISVSRTGGNAGTVAVNYSTSDGTAQASSDYTATSGTLTWTDGDIGNKSFNIPLVANSTTEGNETVLLTLNTPSGGATIGTVANATLTISDDPGTLRFSLADYTVSEDGGSITVNVARVGGSNGPAAVQLMIAQPAAGTGELPARGTANPAEDYTVPPTDVLTWPDGDGTTKSYTITIINSSEIEGEEIIPVALCESSGAPIGSQPTTTITIVEPEELATDGTLSNLLDNKTGPVPLNIPVDITFSELLNPAGWNQDSIVVSFDVPSFDDPATSKMECRLVNDTTEDLFGEYVCSKNSFATYFSCYKSLSGKNVCRVPGSITYDSNTRTLSFTPKEDLPNITTGASIVVAPVEDQGGLKSPGNTYELTTIQDSSEVDNTPPSLLSRTPGIDAVVPTNTPINIVLQDFMMNTTTLNTNSYRLSYDNGGIKQYAAGTISFQAAQQGVGVQDMTVTFHPACPLRPATVYTVELTDGIRDFARNKLIPTTWTFSTQP